MTHEVGDPNENEGEYESEFYNKRHRIERQKIYALAPVEVVRVEANYINTETTEIFKFRNSVERATIEKVNRSVERVSKEIRIMAPIFDRHTQVSSRIKMARIISERYDHIIGYRPVGIDKTGNGIGLFRCDCDIWFTRRIKNVTSVKEGTRQSCGCLANNKSSSHDYKRKKIQDLLEKLIYQIETDVDNAKLAVLQKEQEEMMANFLKSIKQKE